MRVGFVGAGHIARALGQGWSRPELVDPPELTYLDVSAEAALQAADADRRGHRRRISPLSSRRPTSSSSRCGRSTSPRCSSEVAPLLGSRALVSVAAGVALEELRAALPADARVARVMPNVAASLGLGVFLFVPGTLGELERAIQDLFALAGDVVELDERHFDSATAVAGCMPGMLAMLVRDFARAAERRGLDRRCGAPPRHRRRVRRGRGDRP